MDLNQTTALKVAFARNPVGTYLSKHYPYAEAKENLSSYGQTFTLYVEPGADKWHVHGISEIEENPETEGLTLIGLVKVSHEDELLEWFPSFGEWINATIPEEFAHSECAGNNVPCDVCMSVR